jgi:hypothetical protein
MFHVKHFYRLQSKRWTELERQPLYQRLQWPLQAKFIESQRVNFDVAQHQCESGRTKG